MSDLTPSETDLRDFALTLREIAPPVPEASPDVSQDGHDVEEWLAGGALVKQRRFDSRRDQFASASRPLSPAD